MKKTHKKILGFLGLGAVVATTVFAAGLPGPEALAANTITDTIKVTVEGDTPDVNLSGITNNKITVSPEIPFTVDYSGVNTVEVYVTRTDEHGTETEKLVDVIDAEYRTDSRDYNLPFNDTDNGYGYGKYVITVLGAGAGEGDEDSVVFYYYPAIVKNIGTEEGIVTVDVIYDPINLRRDDDNPDGIDHIVVEFCDENGNPIEGLDPKTINPAPGSSKGSVDADFGKLNLPHGTYTIKLTSYDKDGNVIYKTLVYQFNYDGSGHVEPIPVPDTGQFMGGLNISRIDYLVTGLIVFGIAGVGGILIITRKDKKNLSRKNRR